MVKTHLNKLKNLQTVNARDLHEFLESKQDFSTWIKARIDQYGFVNEQDFTVHKIVERKNTKNEYSLSIDMAKELSMKASKNIQIGLNPVFPNTILLMAWILRLIKLSLVKTNR